MHRRGFIKRPRFSFGGNSLVEHDDSSNHSTGNPIDYDEDSLSQQQGTSTSSSEQLYSLGQLMTDRPRRAARPQQKVHQEDKTNLTPCLDYLLRNLSRKDKEGFFQYPVTDQLAPGYSQIILRPMDFSTMKKKIQHEEYANILEFRSDFELMCDNAMKYNRPDTIYWQAAKKLLAFGSKLMHKDKLLSYRRTVECFARLTERELGFRIDSSSNSNLDDSINHLNDSLDPSNNDSDQLSSISVSQACSQRKPKLILKLPKFYNNASSSSASLTTTTTVAAPSVVVEEEEEEEEVESNSLVDDISPEDLLLRVQQASHMAREKFQQRHPMSTFTLDYQRRNGQSSLRLINQDDMTEQLIPLLDSNSSNEEEKEQNALIHDFLDHGPFSSQSTSHNHDSPFASLSKEDLDLLIQTYGSEFSAHYALSLMDFVKDTGDLTLVYVDRLLSVLTNGEHDNYVLKKREKQKIKEEEIPPTDPPVPSIKVEPDSSSSMEKLDSNAPTLPEIDLPDLSDFPPLINGPEQTLSNETPSTFESF